MEVIQKGWGTALPPTLSIHRFTKFLLILRQDVLRSDPLHSPSRAWVEALSSPRIRFPTFPLPGSVLAVCSPHSCPKARPSENLATQSVSVHAAPDAEPALEGEALKNAALKGSSRSTYRDFLRPTQCPAQQLCVMGHAGSPRHPALQPHGFASQGPGLSGSMASAYETPHVKPTRALLRLQSPQGTTARE